MGKGHKGEENPAYKHGKHGCKLYGVWKSMRQRCNNEKQSDYKWYGGRGIAVCEKWNDFKAFYDWAMTAGYKEGLTIDRIDDDGNYSPDNCRWITIQEQQQNKRNVRKITLYNETHTITEWSKISGICRGTISDRLLKGWNEEDAIFKPLAFGEEHQEIMQKRDLKIIEKIKSRIPLKDIAKEFGLSSSNIQFIKKKYGININCKTGKNNKRNTEIIKLMNDGISIDDIALRFDMTHRAVHEICMKDNNYKDKIADEKKQKKTSRLELIRQACLLKSKGMRTKQIAEMVNRSTAWVEQILRKYNLPNQTMELPTEKL